LIFFSCLSLPVRQAGADFSWAREKNIRKPAVSGIWYPANPSSLKKEVDNFLKRAEKGKIEGKIIGLVSPHAGYVYSGQVAAFAYKQLEGLSFETVILLGPSHYFPFSGISVYPEGAYETPLGKVPVDSSLARNLIKENGKIRFYPQAHLREHSLEAQIPFLQRTLKDFKILPLLIGDPSPKNCEILSQSLLKNIRGKNVLIIASTDLSHYHSYKEASRMDRLALALMEKGDPKILFQELARGRIEMCGKGAVITLLLLAKKLGAEKIKVLKYANSGDITGDKSRVVGYGAVVVYKTRSNLQRVEEEEMEESKKLSEEAKKKLLEIARHSIETYLKSKKAPEISLEEPVLQEKRGAFVTLTKNHQLRGCIGRFEPEISLYKIVSRMAIAAATADPRFPPVREEELKDIRIEISALTPLKRVKDVEEIKVGTHGIYIVKGSNKGVLLPQVATEYKWDRTTFLEQTCWKASLPQDAWKDKDAEIYIFGAEIFHE
jgi:AmmeMemoRadiSam system protein B/AmmeMemoRadiSam system protein A